jgi:DNA-binding response OmpR family regulator
MSPQLNFEVVNLTDVPLDVLSGSSQLLPVVLVVDDERAIADTLSIILSRSGFSVMTAYDGETALESAKAVAPALLLSDVMMGPGMDGIQLALEVMKVSPACKVLLFSGHVATRDLLDKARADGHSFTLLSKPLHPADLLARINESFASVQLSAKA